MEDDEYTQLLSAQLQAQAKDRAKAVRNATELLASDLLALLTDIPPSTIRNLQRAIAELPNLQKALDGFPNLDALTKELAGSRKAAEVDKEELKRALSQERMKREELEGAFAEERTKRMESEGAFAEELKRREASLQNALYEERSKQKDLEVAFAEERIKREDFEGVFAEETKKREELERRFLALEQLVAARPETPPPPPPQPVPDLSRLEDLTKWLAIDMGNFAKAVGVDMNAIREKKRSRKQAMGDDDEEPTMMAKLRKTEEVVERLKGLEREPQKLEEVTSLVNTLVEAGAKARNDFSKIDDRLKAMEYLPVKVEAVDKRVTAALEGELKAKTRELERKSDAMAASLKSFQTFPARVEACRNLILKVSEGEEERSKREKDFQLASNNQFTTLDAELVKLANQAVGEVPPPKDSALHPQQLRSFINAVNSSLHLLATDVRDVIRPEQSRLGTSLAALHGRVEKSEPVLQRTVRLINENLEFVDDMQPVMGLLHSALPFLYKEAHLSASARQQQMPLSGVQSTGTLTRRVQPQPNNALSSSTLKNSGRAATAGTLGATTSATSSIIIVDSEDEQLF
ncbi:hypothetical protein P7C70_g9021, partial [Phenoliferia sp. Uapishka_3]